MPPAGTAIAGQVDSIYAFLLISSLISFVILIGGMIWFVFKYKRKSESDKTAYITHNHTLEFLWSFIPFCLFMFVFAWGWIVYHGMRKMPEGALEVHVVAKKWDWRFVYKNGREITSTVDDKGEKVPATMVVPVGRPVRLIMSSEKVNPGGKDPKDRPVLHSFYVPAFRIKQDVVPGRYTDQWFQAEKAGEYIVFCTEYCGSGHYAMGARIKAVSVPEYEEWISGEKATSDKPLSLADVGRNLYATKACIGCHSLNGSAMTGPTWKGLWAQDGHKTSAGAVKVDESYLRESILEPNAKIAAGYSGGQMPSYAGQLSEDDLKAIIEFIKTVK